MLLMRTRRGFTLVELLVALVLFGIVSTAIYQLLVNNQRLYRQQTQRIDLSDNIRSAVAILPFDLRELDAADPAGSDIVSMTDSSITYRAMRTLRWVCVPQNTGGILYLDTTRVGLRNFDATYDSLLIFLDGNSSKTSDDKWVHAGITATPSAANDCAGKSSRRVNIGLTLQTSDSVMRGNPVRGFETNQILRYVDAGGVTWLGVRRLKLQSGWQPLQPIVGPLQPGGLKFTYYAADGSVTADRTQVATIRITVTGRTAQPVRLPGGGMGYATDSLVTMVALRNSR